MTDDLDTLLESNLLEAPTDFSQRVMRAVNGVPPAIHRVQLQRFLQWLAVITATLMGIEQLAGFIFGIWAAVTVG